MAQAYLIDTNYTRPPDLSLSNVSSIPSVSDIQIIPDDNSTTSQHEETLSHSRIPPVSETLPDSPSLPPSLEMSEKEEEEGIPEHPFDIKTSIGQTGAMKGKKRETVTIWKLHFP